MITVEGACYENWADYYDISDLNRQPDKAFYKSIIRRGDRALLELACGTGTITVEVANAIRQNGGAATRIVGIDECARMLQIARQKDPNIEWIKGDMRVPPVQGMFDVVICTFNTLQVLLTDSDMLRTLSSVRSLMHPDGLFAFDIYQPNLAYLNTSRTNHRVRLFSDQDGRDFEVLEDAEYDASAAILSFWWRLLDKSDGSKPPLARLHLRYRQYFACDLEHLLNEAGLVIRERYGDFGKLPFTTASKKQVIVCGRF